MARTLVFVALVALGAVNLNQAQGQVYTQENYAYENGGYGSGIQGYYNQMQANMYGGHNCGRGPTQQDAIAAWAGYCTDDCTITPSGHFGMGGCGLGGRCGCGGTAGACGWGHGCAGHDGARALGWPGHCHCGNPGHGCTCGRSLFHRHGGHGCSAGCDSHRGHLGFTGRRHAFAHSHGACDGCDASQPAVPSVLEAAPAKDQE